MVQRSFCLWVPCLVLGCTTGLGCAAVLAWFGLYSLGFWCNAWLGLSCPFGLCWCPNGLVYQYLWVAFGQPSPVVTGADEDGWSFNPDYDAPDVHYGDELH